MEQKRLTLDEAIEQGYTHYLDENNAVRPLDDIDPEDEYEEFPEGSELMKPGIIQTINVKPEYIQGLIADLLSERAAEEVDDQLVDKIYDHLMMMDCTGIAAQINEYCSKFKHYEIANAILVR